MLQSLLTTDHLSVRNSSRKHFLLLCNGVSDSSRTENDFEARDSLALWNTIILFDDCDMKSIFRVQMMRYPEYRMQSIGFYSQVRRARTIGEAGSGKSVYPICCMHFDRFVLGQDQSRHLLV